MLDPLKYLAFKIIKAIFMAMLICMPWEDHWILFCIATLIVAFMLVIDSILLVDNGVVALVTAFAVALLVFMPSTQEVTIKITTIILVLIEIFTFIIVTLQDIRNLFSSINDDTGEEL